jgi:hypothetical protein
MKSIVVTYETAGTAGMTPAVRPGPDAAGSTSSIWSRVGIHPA